MKQLFGALALLFLLVACREKTVSTAVAPPPVVAAPDSLPAETARAVLTALKTKNWEALIALVHPEEGVRFSPYATVDAKNDLRFSPQALRESVPPSNKGAILWGTQDGSGDPIRLEFGQFFDRYVYDKDFLNAPQQGRGRRIGQGNSIDNLAEAYPGGQFWEAHFPGDDKKYAGMDWRSLRLIFKKSGSRWALVGIVHDQWTS